jgi:topoisomerase-4 subunit B
VQEGRIFIAMPPLYRIDCGKEVLYALDDAQKDKSVKILKIKKESQKLIFKDLKVWVK